MSKLNKENIIVNLFKELFGKTRDGQTIKKFIIRNANGISCTVISYGAILTSFKMPDSYGCEEEITLGFNTLEEYMTRNPYFGATIGRYSNRIAKGRFILNGIQYNLACNENGINHLHGGNKGFDKVIWKAESFKDAQNTGVKFTYFSPDDEEGYPGNLKVCVTYSLNDKNELKLEYWAQTDKSTPVSLTNHAFWNLSGAGSGTILDHELTLNCLQYLPVDETFIPTGEFKDVSGTPMDFTYSKTIGKEFRDVPGGYDHCYVVAPSDQDLKLAAILYDPRSGRSMEVLTTQLGIQFYTGNFLDNVKGANGKIFKKHGALCLETQSLPDSINHPEFPSSILKPGETYRHITVHRFYIK